MSEQENARQRRRYFRQKLDEDSARIRYPNALLTMLAENDWPLPGPDEADAIFDVIFSRIKRAEVEGLE
jgi:hypothetical protein